MDEATKREMLQTLAVYRRNAERAEQRDTEPGLTARHAGYIAASSVYRGALNMYCLATGESVLDVDAQLEKVLA